MAGMTNTPTTDKRPDLEGIAIRAESRERLYSRALSDAEILVLYNASKDEVLNKDIPALIAYIKALEERQVKLEAEVRRRWVNSLIKQGAAPDSAARNVASRPVLDSDGEGDD